ncbi:MAG: SAM-dependent methyltransferase [Candidatus Lokiarchaeota archaeon]|nr:SAM-dependent methyltransferase [Candidatus Lokiarchaeota archaeon]
MFELVFAVLLAVFVLYVKSIWFSVLAIFILGALLLPGVYSMLYGAPFIPTSKKRIKAILDLGNFSERDIVYDLGCGDGRIIRAIAKMKVKKAVGYEFSIPTYLYARLKTALYGRGEKIIFGNFWNKDLADADVLICFFLDRTMRDFERKIWPNLRTGTRVISNEFKMKDVEPKNKQDSVYLYVKKIDSKVSLK